MIAVLPYNDGQWRRFFEINCMGAFLMMRAAVPPMVQQGWGRVVNITTSFFTMLGSLKTVFHFAARMPRGGLALALIMHMKELL